MAQLDEPSDRFRLLAEHAADTDEAIRQEGLESNAYELALKGFTVIENALTSTEIEALKSALLVLAAEDDSRSNRLGAERHKDRTQEVMLLLSRGGRTFERLVMHPQALTLITYLLGWNCVISSVTGYVKGQGDTPLGVHSDTAYVPDPLPPYAQVANVSYCLTDYTPQAGCLTVVPGSHRYCHRPRDGAGGTEAVPVVATAGSAIVFHGNTWHGALARSSPGLRMTVSTLYCRIYMRPQERYDEIIEDAVVARNPPRFRTLVGRDVPTGWRSADDAQRIARLRRGYAPTYYRTRSPFA